MLNAQALQALLTYRRPAWSKSERQAIRRFIDTVPGVRADPFGNRIVRIGNDSTTMISVHTDTVHDLGGRQKILVSKSGVISLEAPKNPSPKSKLRFRNCLGADDGAGIYAALRMIEAKIPALYVFHRAEEIGGHGSDYIARRTPELLTGIERCIALDRRGSTDIITHQMMGKCASDEFAWGLSDMLGLGHEPCPYGTFTDSANYADLIPECTNLSIGYAHEHSARETLDTEYLEILIDKLCTIDLQKLPSERVAGDCMDWRDMDIEIALEGSDVPETSTLITDARSYLDSFLEDYKDSAIWDRIETRLQSEAKRQAEDDWLWNRDDWREK